MEYLKEDTKAEEKIVNKIEDIEEQLNTGKWAYTIVDKEIHFKYLGNKDKTSLGYSLHFDWAEPKEQTNEK